MPGAVYPLPTMRSTPGASLPSGTSLGVLQLLWLLVSGRLLATRGAVIPGLCELGLRAAEAPGRGQRRGTAPGPALPCMAWSSPGTASSASLGAAAMAAGRCSRRWAGHATAAGTGSCASRRSTR